MPTPPESSRFKNTPRRRGKSLSDESAMPTPPDLCHQNTSNQLVVPIPVDIRRQADLLDAIFFWFAHYKAQNEEHRDFLWSVTRQKGVLKTEAPLPWLHWRGCHDDHGQTRNQQNWDKMWYKFLTCSCSEREQLVAWVTICVDEYPVCTKDLQEYLRWSTRTTGLATPDSSPGLDKAYPTYEHLCPLSPVRSENSESA